MRTQGVLLVKVGMALDLSQYARKSEAWQKHLQGLLQMLLSMAYGRTVNDMEVDNCRDGCVWHQEKVNYQVAILRTPKRVSVKRTIYESCIPLLFTTLGGLSPHTPLPSAINIEAS